MQFTFINEESTSQPLKSFLLKQGISHRLYSQLKHWPDNFMVNGQLTTAAAVINFHDQVQITLPAEADDPQVATSFAPLKIIYEDNNWLVIDKPAYLSSVPGPSNRTDTVVNRVKGHWKKQHEQNMVPHIITRLDRDTQGLMLIAKHRLANIWANQQIAQHQIQKLYYALVSGNLTADHGIIDQPIGRPENSIAHQVLSNGQAARTEYWVLERLEQTTLVKVKLHTGRTHQIRVHFKYLGHPLVGDHLYGGPLDLGFEHQALQAYYLQFWDQFQQTTRSFELKQCLIE